MIGMLPDFNFPNVEPIKIRSSDMKIYKSRLPKSLQGDRIYIVNGQLIFKGKRR